MTGVVKGWLLPAVVESGICFRQVMVVVKVDS